MGRGAQDQSTRPGSGWSSYSRHSSSAPSSGDPAAQSTSPGNTIENIYIIYAWLIIITLIVPFSLRSLSVDMYEMWTASPEHSRFFMFY